MLQLNGASGKAAKVVLTGWNQSARNRNFFFDNIKKDYLLLLSSGVRIRILTGWNQSTRNRNFFFDSIKKDFLSFLSSGSEFWPAETNPPEIETFYFIASEKELLDNYIVDNFKKSIFKYLHLPVILIVIKNGNPG